jgi:putative hydrolase
MTEDRPGQPPGEPPEIPLGDILGDAPLLREIQRVMLASTGPINWELARASWGNEDPAPTDEDRKGLAETVRAAELAVADFTGLPTPPDISTVEAFRRAQWVEANTRALRELLDPVAMKMTAALTQAGGAGMPGAGFLPGFTGGPTEPSQDEIQSPEVLRTLMGQMVPLLLGAQVGSVLGYLGQRVLGQFDIAVPRPGGGLYFVIPNIAGFERDWSLSPVEFRLWVALHEVAHRFEFGGAWVRPHFLDLIRDLVEHAEIDLSGLQRQLEGVDFADPDALSDAFEGMGNLFGQAETIEQRLRLARVQAFMAAAEGYADHVMETLGRRMLSSYVQIEEALLRYREGRPADQALERLLGLEMKREQYLLGRQFCEKVVEGTDEATLARMWESAESLPSMPELEEPTLWLSRMA